MQRYEEKSGKSGNLRENQRNSEKNQRNPKKIQRKSGNSEKIREIRINSDKIREKRRFICKFLGISVIFICKSLLISVRIISESLLISVRIISESLLISVRIVSFFCSKSPTPQGSFTFLPFYLFTFKCPCRKNRNCYLCTMRLPESER